MIATVDKPKVKLDLTRAHTRYKAKSGEIVPGVTTILGTMNKPALLEWAYQCGLKGIDYRKVRDQAASIGTLAHFMCECHLKGVEPDFDSHSKDEISKAENAFIKFVSWWDSGGFTLIESESSLVHDHYLYGGTIDCVAKDRNGKIVLIDFKTSKALYEDYTFQVAAYSKLYSENRRQYIDRHVIVRIGKESEGDFEVKELSSLEKEWGIFLACLNLYYAKKKLK